MRLDRDPPVDGQEARITELWVWTSFDPMTDTEGVMAAKLPNGGGLPMVTTMRSQAERMRPLVDAAIRSAEEPRPIPTLRHFVPADDDVPFPEPI